jgi:type I restriction enzyme S subunit
MKLVKDKWELTKLNQICDLLNGYAFKNSDYVAHSNTLNLRMSNIKTNGGFDIEYEQRFLPDDFVNKYPKFIVKDGDLVIAMTDMANDPKILGIPTIVKNPRTYNLLLNQRVGKIIDIKIDKISLDYLIFYLSKPEVRDYYKSISKKGVQINISKQDILSCDVILPPLEEQKKIATLFQSIETAMEQVDGQEKNLHQLKHKLLRDLFSEKQEFGNHLKFKDFETVKFEKIAINISERVEPKKTELTTYVGLEHLDADNLKIERTGTPDDVIGTKLKIYKGDIIFGKRRAYLRKVAVSHFDGIASAHSMILRANEKNIEKDFLPYFMQSDTFMSRAVQISEGSLSPTIKNKTLAVQEFILPKKEKQKELITVFKQFDTTMEQLKQQRTTLKNLKQKLLNEILG